MSVDTKPHILGRLTADEFFGHYWQKKPLLIRQAIPDFQSPLTPDELAGLACEPEVESRLIIKQDGSHPWELREGPFPEETFASLPSTGWTLLVQHVDTLIPQVADLLESFRFLPTWRVDDIMISYAPDQGGVGPHVDTYDVFLLQALGERIWRVEPSPTEDEACIPGLSLRILKDFNPDQEWLLKPGDMLYLPPRYAHHGIAVGDCMTFSIGFRAPQHREILIRHLEHLLDHLGVEVLYQDPDLQAQDNPGEITDVVINKIIARINSYKPDEAGVARWFGSLVTEPKEDMTGPKERPTSPEELRNRILSAGSLRRNGGVRLAYTDIGGKTLLFINGDTMELGGDLSYAAPLLCESIRVNAEQLTAHIEDHDFLTLLTGLYNNGVFSFEDDQE